MKHSKEEIHNLFVEAIAEEMNLDPTKIDINAEFYQHGLDSISIVYVLDKVEDHLGISINPLDFWDYTTIDKFSNYLIEQRLKS